MRDLHGSGPQAAAHWGVPDPASVAGSEDEVTAAFHQAFVTLERRIECFVALPFEALDGPALRQRLDRIGVS